MRDTLLLTAMMTIVGLLPLAPLFLHPLRGRKADGSIPPEAKLYAWIPPLALYWIRQALGLAWLVAGGVCWWRFAIQGLTLRLAAGRAPRPFLSLAVDAIACSACIWAGLDAWFAADRHDPRKTRESG